MNIKPYYILSAIFLLFALQGCLEDNTYIYETPPQQSPVGVSFTDTSLGEGVGGSIEIERAVDESSFSSYLIRWGIGEVAAGNGAEYFIAKINKNRQGEIITHELAPNTPVPEGVDSIVVSAYNAKGESAPVSVLIDNFIGVTPSATTRPTNFVAEDQEATAQIVSDFSFEAAEDETDIEYYYLRFAGPDGCPLVGETAAPAYAAGSEPVIADLLDLGYPPNEATNLLVITGTEFGEYTEADCANYTKAPVDTWSVIDYNIQARMPPSAVAVTDIDEGVDIELQIDVTPAQYEFDVRHYSVYLGSCVHIADLPKGGGRLNYSLTYDQYMETDPFLPFDYFPNRQVIVISDGEHCGQNPRLGANYEENSGEWYLIYHVNPSEVSSIISHYNGPRDGLPYNETGSNSWDAQCLQSTGLSVITTSCLAAEPSQRFRVVSAGDISNENAFFIQSLVDGQCFTRGDADTADAWSITDCNNSDSQKMDLVYIPAEGEEPGSSASFYRNDRIVMRANRTGSEQQSCAASDNTGEIFGTWDNCATASGTHWQFWPSAIPSARRGFNLEPTEEPPEEPPLEP